MLGALLAAITFRDSLDGCGFRAVMMNPGLGGCGFVVGTRWLRLSCRDNESGTYRWLRLAVGALFPGLDGSRLLLAAWQVFYIRNRNKFRQLPPSATTFIDMLADFPIICSSGTFVLYFPRSPPREDSSYASVPFEYGPRD